ncbi:MAG TPA: divergent polysaccharide deacetylase family protein [Syntrophales bacterium]|nr:divergent polysaccharide deacetylase family protein [Syntrophales bacterium]
MVACITGVIGLWLMPGSNRQQAPPRPQAPAALEDTQRADGNRVESPPAVVKKIERKKVAILIDDIGYDPGALRRLLAIEAPVAFAVLPRTPHARSSAEAIHRAGREVLLHLPMEPHGYPDRNPGSGALLAAMTAGQIRRVMEKDLTSVPHAEGVNNHMGSKFMEEREPLGVVFDVLHEWGFYFVDSVTTDSSAAEALAVEKALRFTTRDLFIDDTEDRTRARTNLERLLTTRDRWDGLLLIGHPYPETVSALEEMVPRFQSQGIDIVALSVMVDRKQGLRQAQAPENPGPKGNGNKDRNRKP